MDEGPVASPRSIKVSVVAGLPITDKLDALTFDTVWRGPENLSDVISF